MGSKKAAVVGMRDEGCALAGVPCGEGGGVLDRQVGECERAEVGDEVLCGEAEDGAEGLERRLGRGLYVPVFGWILGGWRGGGFGGQ